MDSLTRQRHLSRDRAEQMVSGEHTQTHRQTDLCMRLVSVVLLAQLQFACQPDCLWAVSRQACHAGAFVCSAAPTPLLMWLCNCLCVVGWLILTISSSFFSLFPDRYCFYAQEIHCYVFDSCSNDCSFSSFFSVLVLSFPTGSHSAGEHVSFSLST